MKSTFLDSARVNLADAALSMRSGCSDLIQALADFSPDNEVITSLVTRYQALAVELERLERTIARENKS